MEDRLRIIRYITGTDKKAIVHFKRCFDAIIFNATIVAHSGASIADLVSMHKRKYIIDPQTHILQQDITAITSNNKQDGDIKNSVLRYLSKLPDALSSIITSQRRPLTISEIEPHIDSLVNSVYNFQTTYVQEHIEKKDYDKYLKFAKLEPEPRLVIAPYFVIKNKYSEDEIDSWLKLNHEALQKTIKLNKERGNLYPVAAQIVLDKAVLISEGFTFKIKCTYECENYEYIFIWVDDFNTFETEIRYMKAFSDLLAALNSIGKKPLMAYGGYESIILCNSGSPYRLYGVAQSVGYGEYRPITPVGGGMPVNKYYFFPLHQRMRFDEALAILTDQGYFSMEKSNKEHADDYYNYICDCNQCRTVIGQDIDNFIKYNESIPFKITTKNGIISRNRPTPYAELIAAFHFLYCKDNEWRQVFTKTYDQLIKELIENYKLYLPEKAQQIVEWCKVYGRKDN